MSASLQQLYETWSAAWDEAESQVKTPSEMEMYALSAVVRPLLAENEMLRAERMLLARLAARLPQFDNSLVVWAAESLRDEVLAEWRALAASQPAVND